jgi:hypothetical protein
MSIDSLRVKQWRTVDGGLCPFHNFPRSIVLVQLYGVQGPDTAAGKRRWEIRNFIELNGVYIVPAGRWLLTTLEESCTAAIGYRTHPRTNSRINLASQPSKRRVPNIMPYTNNKPNRSGEEVTEHSENPREEIINIPSRIITTYNALFTVNHQHPVCVNYSVNLLSNTIGS